MPSGMDRLDADDLVAHAWPQWISSCLASASRSLATLKPGARAISRITASLRVEQIAGGRDLRRQRRGDGHRAVPVGVHEVARAHQHAGDPHLLAEVGEMHVRMARHDGAGQRLEARRPLVDVADGAVGDDAEAAEPLVHGAHHLAPEGAEADLGAVEVLDHHDAGRGLAGDVLVVGDALLALPSCRRARAHAWSGWSPSWRSRRSAAVSGNGHTSGLTVKPVSRRAGSTISSALQMVGVS